MNTPNPMNRRTAMQWLALGAGTAAMSTSGFAGVIGNTCPDDPKQQGGIDWIPDVMHPVAAGFKDYSLVNRAPGTVRVWYPSYKPSIEASADAPILQHCIARYPVVLLTHGSPPCDVPNAGYFTAWSTLPAELARSGYVVLVPQLDRLNPFEESFANQTAQFIDWARSGWEHSRWVDKRPESTGLIGHSWGAMVAARIALLRPTISACVFLSGVWEEFNDHIEVLKAVNRPSLFTYIPRALFEDMDVHGLLSSLRYTTYAARFPGEHFDYINRTTTCDFHGPCRQFQPAIADIATLFMARFMPPYQSTTLIPHTLIPPNSPLTPKQAPYGAERLRGIGLINNAADCSIDLEWKFNLLKFHRHFGGGA